MRNVLFVLALALLVCGCDKCPSNSMPSSMPYGEFSGHIEGYTYRVWSSELTGIRITLHPGKSAVTQDFSGTRISAFDMQGDGDWYLVLFCDGTQLSQNSDGCDIASNTSGQWIYSPCDKKYCRKADERILTASEINPIIDAMNKAYADAARHGSTPS